MKSHPASSPPVSYPFAEEVLDPDSIWQYACSYYMRNCLHGLGRLCIPAAILAIIGAIAAILRVCSVWNAIIDLSQCIPICRIVYLMLIAVALITLHHHIGQRAQLFASDAVAFGTRTYADIHNLYRNQHF